MVEYSKDCGPCDPCGCKEWKKKLDEAWDRAQISIARVVTIDGRTYVSDGSGTITPPLPVPTEAMLDVLNQFPETVARIDEDIEDIEDSITQIQTDASGLAGRVTTLEGSSAEHETELDKLIPDVASLKSTSDGHTTQISELSTAVSQDGTAIEALQGRMTTAEQDIAALQNTTGTMGSDLETAESDIAGLKTRMTAVENKASGNSSDIAALQNKETSQDSSIAGLVARMNTAEGAINDFEQTDADFQTAIDNAEANISTLSGQVGTINGEIDGLLKEVVNTVDLNAPAFGTAQIVITHEDETTTVSDPLNLGLIQQGGVQLLSAVGDRAFKLRFTQTDGTVWDTNTFLIPDGELGELVPTSVSIVAGTASGTMKVSIGLEGGNSLDSNDFPYTSPQDLVPINSAITTLQADVTNLKSRMTTAEGKITTLQSTTGTIGSDLETAESDIAGLKTRVTAVENKATANASDIDALQTDVTGAESDISNLQGRMTTVEGKANTNASNITALDSELGTAQSAITALQGRMTDAENEISALDTASGGQASAITTLQSDMTQAKSNISNLQGRMATAEGDITAAEGDIADLETRVGNLETQPGYSLPVATSTVLGGVRIGANMQAPGGVLTVGPDVLTTADEGVEYLGTAANPTALDLSVSGQTLSATLVRESGNLSGSVELPTPEVAGMPSVVYVPTGNDQVLSCQEFIDLVNAQVAKGPIFVAISGSNWGSNENQKASLMGILTGPIPTASGSGTSPPPEPAGTNFCGVYTRIADGVSVAVDHLWKRVWTNYSDYSLYIETRDLSATTQVISNNVDEIEFTLRDKIQTSIVTYP